MFSEPPSSAALFPLESSLLPRAFLSIRRAEKKDIDALFELESQSFDPAMAFNRRQIQGLLRNARAAFWLLTADRRLIAQLLILKRRQGSQIVARVYSLTVAPDMRGRGYSRQLLSWGLEDLRQQGIEKVTLEVEATAVAPLRLYQSFGFSADRTLPDYYGPGRNGLKMRLELHLSATN